MTAQTRSTNISRFQQGDQPQGSDYNDLIDSFVSLADTTAQVVSSDFRANNFITSGEVSAAVISAPTFSLTNINATRTQTTDLVVSTSARISGTLEVPASAAFSGATTFVSPVSASSVWITTLALTSGAGASGIVRTTANNPVILSSANQGLTLCRGFTRILVDGTTAYVPFFYAT